MSREVDVRPGDRFEDRAVHFFVPGHDGGSRLAGGRIVRPITPDVLDQHDSEWRPYIGAEADVGWTWRQWASDGDPLADGRMCRHYALMYGDIAQGLAIVRQRYEMISPKNGGRDGCFLEYLAVAPWNRRDARTRVRLCTLHPRAWPIGKLLAARAIQLSRELGYDGRLAWESKPTAVQQYRSWFPDALCIRVFDEGEWWPYFELTTTQSEAFLGSLAEFF